MIDRRRDRLIGAGDVAKDYVTGDDRQYDDVMYTLRQNSPKMQHFTKRAKLLQLFYKNQQSISLRLILK